MNKILILLSINSKLYYQIFLSGKAVDSVRSIVIQEQKEEVAIRKVLRDKALLDANIGVLTSCLTTDIDSIIATSKVKSYEILREFDDYANYIKGSFRGISSDSCIVDAISEDIRAYSFEEEIQKIEYKWTKTAIKNIFFDRVIDKTFKTSKPKLEENEKEKLKEEWITKLKDTTELREEVTIGEKNGYLNIDYNEFTNWMFGDFPQQIIDTFPEKKVIYLLGDFLNNGKLKEKFDRYEKIIPFDEQKSFEFIMKRIYQYVQKESQDKIVIDASKTYSLVQLTNKYEKNDVKYFLSFDEFKKDIKTKDQEENDKNKLREAIHREVGQQRTISDEAKSNLHGEAKSLSLPLSFVDKEIIQLLEYNTKVYTKKKEKARLEIVRIVNKHRKTKKYFTSSKKVERNISKELKTLNIKGLDLNTEEIIQSQLVSLDTFYEVYKNTPNTIKYNDLPKGIQSIEDGQRFIYTVNRIEKIWKQVGIVSIVAIILLIVFLVVTNMDFGGLGGTETEPEKTEQNQNNEDENSEENESSEYSQENNSEENENEYEGVSPELVSLLKNDYSKTPQRLKEAFKEIHSTKNTRREAADLAKKINGDLEGWKLKVKYETNLGIDNKTRTINEFTGEIRGDRDKQTIQSIDFKLPISIVEKEIKLTVIREIR